MAMNSKRVWVISSALLGILLLNEYHSQRGQAEAVRSELAGLRAQQDRLEIEARRPALVVRTQAAGAAEPSRVAPSSALPATGGDHASDPATPDQRWEEDARASQASVEHAFAAEPIDQAWAAPTRSALQDRLVSLARPLASSLHGIDCRSSICRVEIFHRDADAARRFAQTAFTDLQEQAWSGPAVLLPARSTPDGGVTVVMYLGREGTSLLR
jgi:hypothetical protein